MNPPNPPQPDVPAEIRAELARRGWSLRDLAERTDINHATLWRRMRNDGRLTFPEAARISEALGLSLSALIARAEDAA